jgi:hypothetical protein
MTQSSRRPAPSGALRRFGVAALLPAVLGLAVLAAPVEKAHACRVAIPERDYATTVKMLRRSDAVFVGTVLSIDDRPVVDGNSFARMRVDRVWKGKPAKRITLYRPWLNLCEQQVAEHLRKPFAKGVRYLVFAHKAVRGYRVIHGYFYFRDGKAPEAVMRALRDHKSAG